MMLARAPRGLVLARSVRTRLSCSLGPSAINRSLRLPQSDLRATPTSRKFHASPLTQRPAAAAATAQQEESPVPSSDGRITEFSELVEKGLVNRRIVQAITRDMSIKTMTEVQSLTLNSTLKGTDVIAQAKTGTGKTLAFLVPILENMLREDPRLESRSKAVSRPNSMDIRGIIVSPTRELAEQIAAEAQKVIRHTGLVVQTAVGGTHKREGLQRIQRGCHLLVGTPGRLIDILSDPLSKVRAPNLNAFVLDEADRLLDIGFAPDIKRMQEYLPPRSRVDRQTLLFSATVPKSVMDVVATTMKPDYEFVQTVREDETPTHLAVPQKAVMLRGLENQMPVLLDLVNKALAKHREDPSNNQPFKAIVYFNSTSEVNMAAETFRALRVDRKNRIQMTQMHARLTQAARTRNSDTFRRAVSGILFSSDVTARGMDFPNVTHVIQVGVPRDRETYVHRLGRTARANKSGEGWLFLTDLEAGSSMHKLRDLPITVDKTNTSIASADMAADLEDHPPEVSKTLNEVTSASRYIPDDIKETAYLSQVNFVASLRDRRGGLQMLKNLAKYGWGMEEPPQIPPRLAKFLTSGGSFTDSRSKSFDRSRSSGPRRSFDRSPGSSRSFDRSSGSRPFDRSSGPSRPFDRSSGPSRSFDRSSGPSRSFDRSSGPSRSFDRSSGPRRSFDRSGSQDYRGGSRGGGRTSRHVDRGF